MEEPLCAQVVAAHDHRVAIEPQSAIRNRLEANSFKNFTGRGVSLARKKPHETSWGFRHRSFSRRAWPSAAWEGGLAYGSLADHSGGGAARSHAPPPPPRPPNKIFSFFPPPGGGMVGRASADPKKNTRG